jgi:hypothetical protein
LFINCELLRLRGLRLGVSNRLRLGRGLFLLGPVSGRPGRLHNDLNFDRVVGCLLLGARAAEKDQQARQKESMT